MGLFEDLKNGNIKSIIIIILIVLILNLYLWKEEKKESMADVSNDIKEAIKEAVKEVYLPKGSIIAYNLTSAPSGWTLCDGSNGSPDLRGKFIFGNGGSRGMNSTGGAETVALLEGQMPQHTHGASVSDPGHQHHMIEGMGIVNAGRSWYARDGGFGGAHPRTNVVRTGISVGISHSGGNQPHENMPPFYVLTYIMKL